MSEGIIQPILEELESRFVYKADVYAPFYISSYATHVFNLHNQENEVYWESKKIPNLRLHLMFIAPPGFMKSFYGDTMCGNTYSIFGNTGVDIGIEASMTEAGLVGTVTQEGTAVVGAAGIYSKGIVFIDEFSAITNALQSQYNSQMDPQLLSILDSGKVSKRLSAGPLTYDTNMTLWTGVQPAKYDLSSGMGRRLCFMLFVPTAADNAELIRRQRLMRNIETNKGQLELLRTKINNWRSSIYNIQHVEFDSSVDRMHEKLGLFSFEVSHFNRIMLGYCLARDGGDTSVTIDAKDKNLIQLLERAKRWRDSIVMGVDYLQLMKTVRIQGDAKANADMGTISYTCEKKYLIKESLMVGWNTQQVSEKLIEMNRFGLIKLSGSQVIITDRLEDSLEDMADFEAAQ